MMSLLSAGCGSALDVRMWHTRHFAAAQQFGRIWSEADINHRAGFMSTRP